VLISPTRRNEILNNQNWQCSEFIHLGRVIRAIGGKFLCLSCAELKTAEPALSVVLLLVNRLEFLIDDLSCKTIDRNM
jgi:hypothetical protein